jgi:hypothetical protein
LSGRLAQLGRVGAVNDHDVGAGASQQSAGSAAAAPEADHKYLFIFQVKHFGT